VLEAGADPRYASPGVLGFLVVFCLAVATYLLIRSMVGHLRKVRYRAELDGSGGSGGSGGSAAPAEPGSTDGAVAGGAVAEGAAPSPAPGKGGVKRPGGRR
jgi:hypothetical protein